MESYDGPERPTFTPPPAPMNADQIAHITGTEAPESMVDRLAPPVEENLGRPTRYLGDVAAGTSIVPRPIDATSAEIERTDRGSVDSFRLYEGEVLDTRVPTFSREVAHAIADGGKAVVVGDDRGFVREGVGKIAETYLTERDQPQGNSLGLSLQFRPTQPGKPSYLAECAAADPEFLTVNTLTVREALRDLPPHALTRIIAVAAGGNDPTRTDTYETILNKVVEVLSSPPEGTPPEEVKTRTPDPYEVRDGVRVLVGAQVPNRFNETQVNDVPNLHGPGGTDEVTETAEQIKKAVSKSVAETSRAEIHDLNRWLDSAFPDRANTTPGYYHRPSSPSPLPAHHYTVNEINVSGSGSYLDKQQAILASLADMVIAEETPWGTQPAIVVAHNLNHAGPGAKKILETVRDQEVPIVVSVSEVNEETVPLVDGAQALTIAQLSSRQTRVLAEQVLPVVTRTTVTGTNISISGGRGDSLNEGQNVSFDRIEHSPAGGGKSEGASDSFTLTASKAQNVSIGPGSLATANELTEDVGPGEFVVVIGTAAKIYNVHTGEVRTFPPEPAEQPMHVDDEIAYVLNAVNANQLRRAAPSGTIHELATGDATKALPSRPAE